MSKNDRRPGQIARHTTNLTTDTERAAEGILNIGTHTDLDVPRRPIERTAKTGVSRPTEAALIQVETAAERYAERLVTITLELAETADRLGQPVTGHDVIILADEVRGGLVGRHAWRHAIRHCALACHEAAEGVHDGWADWHRNRWRHLGDGTPVLDEGIDADLTSVLWVVDRHARDARALATAVRPRGLRACACGCRRPAPPVGQGATRPACRKQQQRDRAS